MTFTIDINELTLKDPWYFPFWKLTWSGFLAELSSSGQQIVKQCNYCLSCSLNYARYVKFCFAVEERVVRGFCARRQARGMTELWKRLRSVMGAGLRSLGMAPRNDCRVCFCSAWKLCLNPGLCGKSDTSSGQRVPKEQLLPQGDCSLNSIEEIKHWFQQLMKENTATLAVAAGAASVARGAVAAGLRYHHLFSSSALGSHIGCSESQTLDIFR